MGCVSIYVHCPSTSNGPKTTDKWCAVSRRPTLRSRSTRSSRVTASATVLRADVAVASWRTRIADVTVYIYTSIRARGFDDRRAYARGRSLFANNPLDSDHLEFHSYTYTVARSRLPADLIRRTVAAPIAA